ncbi:SatD family protein [Xylanimonas sp. McL0601]|uniref:SatD family protein n=1 Tax=Xylanimonas sp. McL0601 TaxID=3414739 RepID=UPI003CF0557E
MIVITADQRDSTHTTDRVPDALELVSRVCAGRDGVVLPFDRTVGDELQGLLDSTPDGAALAVDLALALARDGSWSVGIGVGSISEPLPAASREASGRAFVHARRAVDRAKRRGAAGPGAGGISVVADDAAAAGAVEALLRMIAALAARRTDRGWEAVDAVARTGSQKAAATALGVTVQAVSQRLRAALAGEEAAVRPVAARLLATIAR